MKEYKNEKSEFHRNDGPAVINGNINGKLHREDGHSYINTISGSKIWFINGKIHREDGPAYINANSSYKAWYINGKRHREDGPAVIRGEIKEWYINGKRHREDGPAIIDRDIKEWWINDIERDKKWVEKYLKIRKKHLLLGIIVSDYWKIREIILRWRYNPNLKCVKNRLEMEFYSYNII
jgi:hypothetical protein